jgi:hypothetical protein
MLVRVRHSTLQKGHGQVGLLLWNYLSVRTLFCLMHYVPTKEMLGFYGSIRGRCQCWVLTLEITISVLLVFEAAAQNICGYRAMQGNLFYWTLDPTALKSTSSMHLQCARA